MRRIVLWILLWGVATTACGVVGRLDPKYLIPSERKLKVTEAAEAYSTSLRWGYFDEAVNWVHPSWRRSFLAQVNNPRAPLRFTLFEVNNIELGPEMDRAEVWVSFALYRPPSLREWTITERQVWRYDPTVRRWYIEPDIGLYRGDVGSSHPPPEPGQARER